MKKILLSVVTLILLSNFVYSDELLVGNDNVLNVASFEWGLGAPGSYLKNITSDFNIGNSDKCVSSVEIYAKQEGTPTESYSITIENDNPGAPYNPSRLVNPDASVSGNFNDNFTSSGSWYNFTFGSEFQLNGSTTYWIVLRVHGLEGSGNHYWAGRDTTQSYPDGTLYYQQLGAGSGAWISHASDLNFRIWGGDCQSTSISPTIETYNCTSCDQPATSAPFTSQDTTPTFSITTDINANCAIGTVDENYSTTTSNNLERNCTNTSSTNHICTLPYSDGLLMNETDNLYIACQSMSDGLENITSTSGSLLMNITTAQVEVLGDEAIEAGINSSFIFPTTVYSNQQVYIRDLNNNQKLGTFDRVATFNLKRWALNYVTSAESLITDLFNITPSFYAQEYQDMTYKAINDSVRELINNTYS
jgi:hypothetical protein